MLAVADLLHELFELADQPGIDRPPLVRLAGASEQQSAFDRFPRPTVVLYVIDNRVDRFGLKNGLASPLGLHPA